MIHIDRIKDEMIAKNTLLYEKDIFYIALRFYH